LPQSRKTHIRISRINVHVVTRTTCGLCALAGRRLPHCTQGAVQSSAT